MKICAQGWLAPLSHLPDLCAPTYAGIPCLKTWQLWKEPWKFTCSPSTGPSLQQVPVYTRTLSSKEELAVPGVGLPVCAAALHAPAFAERKHCRFTSFKPSCPHHPNDAGQTSELAKVISKIWGVALSLTAARNNSKIKQSIKFNPSLSFGWYYLSNWAHITEHTLLQVYGQCWKEGLINQLHMCCSADCLHTRDTHSG